MEAKEVLTKLAFNLKIIPFQKNHIPAIRLPFIAMVNPDNFTVTEVLDYHLDAKPRGQRGSDPVYQGACGGGFTLEFFLDGTGVNGVKIPVVAQVTLFKQATSDLIGLIHRPPYLLVQYGTFIRDCVLMSSDISYTLFDQYGVPLRAKIKAVFKERIDSKINQIASAFSSPDLTHHRETGEGDLLPLITYEVYNNQHYYLQVAKVNRLKNFRKLEAGTTLFLPPLK